MNLTTEKLAAILRVSDTTISNWRKVGMPHTGRSRAPYWHNVTEVRTWLENYDGGRLRRHCAPLLAAMIEEHHEHYRRKR